MSIRLLRITIITLILTFAAAGTALAVPPLPLDLYGTVKLDGQNVPDGTSIAVQCGGVTYATMTTTTTVNGESYYLGPNGTGPLSVPGDDNDTPNTKEGCTDGETVTFLVNGAAAAETTSWASGVQRQVNLTGTSTSPAELTIPTDIPAYPGATVELPVTLTSNGHPVTALAFSIDYDETCLLFDPNATNAVTFSVPQLFAPSYAFDTTDTDGEIDISLVYISAPLVALPDGVVLTLRLTVQNQPTCTPSTGNPLTAAVAVSTDPTASFGLTNGTSAPGTTSDGSVLISGIRPGDCNGDGSVDAADLSACVLEIFDGDSTSAADAPNGSFPGTAGCDSNGDGSIDAGDLACTILTIFNGPNACGGAQAATNAAPAQLTIAPDLAATAGGQVQVPVLLMGNGHAVTTAAFSLRFDADYLSFDATDHNGDGLPDAVADQLPAGALRSIEVVGETINIVLADFAAQPTLLRDGPLVTLTFQVKERMGRVPFATAVTFDAGLSPSLGSATGTAVAVIAEDGAVQVQPLAPAVEIHLPLILNQ